MRIQTKFILAILLVTLLPVLPLYFVINSFFEKSIDVGLNFQMERALEEATHLSKMLYSEYREEVLSFTTRLVKRADIQDLLTGHPVSRTTSVLEPSFSFPYRLQVYNHRGKLVYQASTEEREYPPVYENVVRPLLSENSARILQAGISPNYISAAAPIGPVNGSTGVLIVTARVHEDFLRASRTVIEMNQMFKTLAMAREDLQRSFLLTFFVIYIPFSLLAVLLGFFLSQRITRPIRKLSEGTRRIAAGDWEHRVQVRSRDEIGHLVDSFNFMIEQIQQHQRQIIELEKTAMWREMARVLAHEIKNPLTPIQLTIQQLKDKFPGEPSEYRKLLFEGTQIILDEIKSLQKLVREFSDFARMPGLQFQKGHLNELIEEICRLYAEAPIELALDPQLPGFYFDVEQMRRVVINLIENSLHSIREKGSGSLSIRTQRDNGFILLEMKDTGTGISEEVLAKVYEPYFSTKKHGMGLGLAIVQKIIKEHGGSIHIDSRPGAWTRVHIRLPFYQHPPHETGT